MLRLQDRAGRLESFFRPAHQFLYAGSPEWNNTSNINFTGLEHKLEQENTEPLVICTRFECRRIVLPFTAVPVWCYNVTGSCARARIQIKVK